ncbi:MAG: hypothetical protein WAN10_13220 [Candidatus Acidiferrales bacterium]
MAKIVDRVIEGLRGFLNPALARQESAEARALRQMYDTSNAENLIRACWYAEINQLGIRTRVAWNCNCSFYSRFLESEKFKSWSCGQCKRQLDFAGWTGIRLSRNKTDRAQTLARLNGIVSEADYLASTDGDWLRPDKHDLVLRHVLKVRPALNERHAAASIMAFGGEVSGDTDYEPFDPGMSGAGFGVGFNGK